MSGPEVRVKWVQVLERIARPVLLAGAAGELRRRLPTFPGHESRDDFAALEALARTLVGIAPWLQLKDGDDAESALGQEMRSLALQAIDAGTDPQSADPLNFVRGSQPLVDAAFLAHALLRAPRLWQELPDRSRGNVIDCLKATRAITPALCNWLLFAAIIEAFLYRQGEDLSLERIRSAFDHHEQWYLGDGTYSDGEHYHCDYYNSFVIQPMYLDAIEALAPLDEKFASKVPEVIRRARRHAAIQERMIAADGTFPPVGRSLVYRFGAFQLLAQMALRHELPEGVKPAQVRGALTAVIRRTMDAPGTFTPEGWLTAGLCGNQPELAEPYISSGSLYLCTAGLLPLGLAVTDRFWSDPGEPWTQVRAWSGQSLAADHAID